MAAMTLSRARSLFLLDGEARGLSPRTLEAQRWALGHLQQAVGERRLASVDALALREALASYLRGHRASSAHGLYRVWRRFFRFCVAEGWIARDPMAAVQPPRLPDSIPLGYRAEELERLIAAATAPRDRAIVLTLIDTGLRASELCQLTRDAMEELGGATVLRVRGKGGRERLAPLSDETAFALRRLLALRDDGAPQLFVSTRGARPLTRGALLQLARRLGQRAGVPGANVHRFRRAALAAYLAAGVDPLAVQAIAGHRSGAMLRHYTRYAEMERAIAAARRALRDRAGRSTRSGRR